MEAVRVIAILNEEYKAYANKMHSQIALSSDHDHRQELLSQIGGVNDFMTSIHNRLAMESASTYNHSYSTPKHEKVSSNSPTGMAE